MLSERIMTAIILCHDHDRSQRGRPETGAVLKQQLEMVCPLVEIDFKRQVLYCQQLELRELEKVTEPPQLVIVHVSHPDYSDIRYECEQRRLPLLLVTDQPGEENQATFFDNHPRLMQAYQKASDLRDLLICWKEKFAWAPERLADAWREIPTHQRGQQADVRSQLLHELTALDLLLQSYLLIWSDEREWQQARKLPGVLDGHQGSTAKEQTLPDKLFAPVADVSTSGKVSYWFGSIRQALSRDGILSSGQFKEVLSKAALHQSSENQARLERFFSAHAHSPSALEWWDTWEEPGEPFPCWSGALFLCLALILQGGHYQEIKVEATTSPRQLCAVFQVAHEEAQFCCQLLSEAFYEG